MVRSIAMFVVLSAAAPAMAQGVDAPKDVFEVFHAAVATGDPKGFLATCDQAIAKYDGIGTCGYLYDLAKNQGMKMSLAADETKGNRATLDFKGELNGQVVENFYLLLNETGGKWLVTSYRTNPDRKAAHLAAGE
jgi:hypothetical protein